MKDFVYNAGVKIVYGANQIGYVAKEISKL